MTFDPEIGHNGCAEESKKACELELQRLNNFSYMMYIYIYIDIYIYAFIGSWFDEHSIRCVFGHFRVCVLFRVIGVSSIHWVVVMVVVVGQPQIEWNPSTHPHNNVWDG
jgi:hypothetical protein